MEQQERLEIQEACLESLEEEKARHDYHESARAELHAMVKESDTGGRVPSCIFLSSSSNFLLLISSSSFLFF
jgi:hypothetical protein